MQRKIMFICTGNICRSAMAEYILKKKVEEKGVCDRFLICSSGIYAYGGEKSTYEAVSIMQNEYDINLSNHRATAVRESDIENMDLVLCMTNSHKNTLNLMYPNLSDKIYLIKEYVGLDGEVEDPYGGSLSVYSNCAKDLSFYLDKLLEKEGF